MMRAERDRNATNFPCGKDFAFSIFDDTDVATLDYVRPIYEFLSEAGMRITKTVWPLPYEGVCDYSGSDTLGNDRYADFIKLLQGRGFEIGFHGATMVSSTREKIAKSFDVFHDILGRYPRIYAAHGVNRDNLYWGRSRISTPLFQQIGRWMTREGNNYYQGHVEGSPNFWGDLSLKHIDYVRNFTFDDINLLNIDVRVPYRDRKKPWVKFWFYTCDADNVEDFNRLLSERNQDRLLEERGLCIVSTHLGKGFLKNGNPHKEMRRLLDRLSRMNGWFVPVSEILDFLRSSKAQIDENPISDAELFRLERKWAEDCFWRRIKSRNYEKTELEYLEKNLRAGLNGPHVS